MDCQGMALLNRSKGHLSRSKRLEKIKLWYFLLLGNFLKHGVMTFLYLLGDDHDQLSRDGLD